MKKQRICKNKKCGHNDWDHYKGKCYGWTDDGANCKCNSFKDEDSQ